MALEPAEARGARPGVAEARARFRVARFIMEAGVKLGLGSVALATACAAFHRFSRAVGPAAPHDPHLVAAAALFLAGKAQGTPLRARDVLNVAHRCLHPGQPPPGLDGGFWGLRDSLLQCELLLLRVLRFRVPVAHPHKYLLQYLLALGRWGRRGGGGWGAPPGAGGLVGAGAGRGGGGAGAAPPPPAPGGRRPPPGPGPLRPPGPPGDPPALVAGAEPGAGRGGAGGDRAGAAGALRPRHPGGGRRRPPPRPPRHAAAASVTSFNDRRPRGGGGGAKEGVFWGGGGAHTRVLGFV